MALPLPLSHSVVCPVLVGRAEPLAVARELLERAREGAGGVLLVSGEAGVGKSRLLRAATEEARQAGFVVLRGACFEADRSIPYAPLLDLVRTFAASTSAAAAAHLFAPSASELLAAFPELEAMFGDVAPSASIDPELDRRRLFHALSRTVTSIARTQPAMLVFEDVHWSDEASLSFLRFLAREIASPPTSQRALLALSFRADEAGAHLSRLLAELDRLRLAVEIPLARLSPDQVGTMLAATLGDAEGVDDAFVRALYELTEGNPFFVEEVLKGLVTAGELSQAANRRWRARSLAGAQVPRTAVEAVRRRLSGLTAEARHTASLAAVAGRRFDFALLRALSGLDEETLLAHVKELVSAQLVEEESTERFAFRHALTREAIRAELLVRERAAIHRDVAAALEQHHAGALAPHLAALAYPAFEGGDWSRARAYGAAAAEHALTLHAPDDAVSLAERALAAAARDGVPADPELLLTRGRARETLGDIDGADADFTTVLALARTGARRDVQWQALHALGMLWAARDQGRAGAYRHDALALARDIGDTALIAQSLNRVGNWHLNLERPAPALRHHTEALALFERLGDARGVAETVDLAAMALHIAGDEPAAMAQYERAVALFTDLGDRRGLARALGLVALCGPSVHCSATVFGSSALTADVLASERSVRLAHEIGWRAGETFCQFLLADCLTWRGAYDRALALTRAALATAHDIEHLQWQCGALRILGCIALDLLAPDEARRHLQPAYALATRLGSHTWVRWTGAYLATALAQLGDPAAAHAVLDAATAPAATGREALLPGDERTPTLGERLLMIGRIRVALAGGQAEQALVLADDALRGERERHHGAPPRVPLLELLRGQALAALEHLDEAEDALLGARESAALSESLPMAWRAQAALGDVYRRQRRRVESRDAYAVAREIVGQLSPRITEQSLRAAFDRGTQALIPPMGPPSASQAAKAAFGGLTKREREVARLVAAGKSNRAIGRTLGIGERTVEDHVANALAKLSFTSRTQLAGWAVERELAERPERQQGR